MFKSDKDSRLRYDSCNWQLADATSLKAWTTSRRLYFFKEALPEGARNIHHTYTPVTKHGVVLEGDAPWEIKSHVSSFCGSILRLDDMRFRLYYTIYNNKEMRMAVAESEDGIHWFRIPLGQEYRNGFNTNLIVLNGIPGEKTGVRYTGEVIAPDGRLDDNTGQLKYQSQVGGPQVLRLPDGGWRMYYWHHQEGWGRIPYIYTVAESKDGINWDVPDYERPVFISHFMGDQSELSKEEVLTEKAIRTNDSNYVYYNHNLGCYEQYSQFFLDSAAERQVKEDNCPDFNRMIQRRVSPEGLTWSAPELVIQADTQDPWDLQFYHLSVQYHEDWIIGSLGHYRVENSQQSMDIELVFSRNGRNWERPLRGGFIPRDPAGRDTEGIYPTNAWIDRGDSWLCLYDAVPIKHNQYTSSSELPVTCIMAASWPKHRFVGLRAERVPGGFLTPVFLPQEPLIYVDACICGWLRAELCDAWGHKLKGYHLEDSIPVQGDSQAHELRWKERNTKELIYDPVRLRFEFSDGDIYGVSF